MYFSNFNIYSDDQPPSSLMIQTLTSLIHLLDLFIYLFILFYFILFHFIQTRPSIHQCYSFIYSNLTDHYSFVSFLHLKTVNTCSSFPSNPTESISSSPSSPRTLPPTDPNIIQQPIPPFRNQMDPQQPTPPTHQLILQPNNTTTTQQHHDQHPTTTSSSSIIISIIYHHPSSTILIVHSRP